jgi:D-hydroxyproline dehydrogenase subunit alpha
MSWTRLPGAPAFTFRFDEERIMAAPGQTVAAALWAAGIRSWRTTRGSGTPRGLFCGIGACFECLITIDGEPNQRACLVPARQDMVVTTQLGTGHGPPAAAGPESRERSDRAERSATGRDQAHDPRERMRAPASSAVFDVVVVGAGPAGLATAVTAALAGCRVALLDSAPQLGGQFWRHHDDSGRGHRDWSVFAALRAELLDLDIEYHAGAAVWFVEREPAGFTLQVTGRDPVVARRIVFATGAYDRPLPFPGWDLPGVVTPGAAQALLKGSGVAVGSRMVVAGAGPFLLPVATGLLESGVRVAGVYEAGDPLRYARRPGAIAIGKLGEAAGYAAMLARHRVPYRTRHAVVAAWGTSSVSSVDVVRLDRRGRTVPGTRRTVECDAVAVGFGFTPQLELPLSLGCDTRLDVDGNLVLEVDVAGRTTVPGAYAAGEVTGVGGASLALTEGRLIGAVVALAAGRRSPYQDLEMTQLLAKRARQRKFARLMHEVHAPPAGWMSWLDGQTLVCRCEEVPVSRIRAAVTDQGATDARTVKGLCRSGMGWCQGRMCGYATAALTAHLCGRRLAAADLETFGRRPIAQPVTLGDLAEQSKGDDL